jgi:hypothetical protein
MDLYFARIVHVLMLYRYYKYQKGNGSQSMDTITPDSRVLALDIETGK